MANKIITIGNVKEENVLKVGALKDEVYVDVSMLADNAFHQMPVKTDEGDYLSLLIAEHSSEQGAFEYIVSEESREFSQESKEFIKVQYESCMDYGKALRLWCLYGKWKIGKLVNVKAI